MTAERFHNLTPDEREREIERRKRRIARIRADMQAAKEEVQRKIHKAGKPR